MIENSVQDCLPYIPYTTGPCTTTLAYPKWPCVCLKTTMCIIYSIILSLPESSIVFYYSMWSCDNVTCDIPLNPNPSSKNGIADKKRREK